MTRKRSIIFPIALSFVLSGLVLSLQAQEDDGPVTVTLHPQDEPKPAMRYRLLPGAMDWIPGNAAVDYGKVTAENSTYFNYNNRAVWDNIEDVWPNMPLAELQLEDVGVPNSSIYFLKRGARRKFCDWQLPIGDEPFYQILLPEAQESRNYARILAVRARQHLAFAEFDQAIETLQAGYALGRNVAQGETFVNGLVGIAICGIMNRQLIDLVQQPDAPNLYWALTMLPRPFIDIRAAVDVEANGLELSFPELRDLETAERTSDEWRALFHRFATTARELIGRRGDPPPPSAEELDRRCERLAPQARRILTDSGLPAEQVNRMPVYQVALLYTRRVHRELLEDGLKYYYLPFPQAIARIDAAIEHAKEEGGEILPLAQRTLPAIRAAHLAIVRGERQFAVLRVCEALRIHAARHDGELPATLADLTDVPLPGDPVNGKPFEYRLEDGKAYLSGPPLPGHPLNYEITMAER